MDKVVEHKRVPSVGGDELSEKHQFTVEETI